MKLDLAAWRQFSAQAFGLLLVQPKDEEYFSATVRQARLEDVHLVELSSGPHRVERPPELAAKNAAAVCKLSLQIRGRCVLRQDGRRVELGPGDVALYVTHRPYRLDFLDDQQSMVVAFPREALRMSDVQLGLITATRLSRDTGLGQVAVPLFEQMAEHLDVLTGADAITLVHSALDIVATALAAAARSTGRDSSEPPLFHRAVTHIEAHLHDPDLSPSLVAAALHVSLRQLQSRFSDHGLGVAAFIRARRLEHLRRDLADPVYADMPVHAISIRYGLPNPSHVSKTFRAEYGESPRQFRDRILQRGAAA
ncbi:putative AraC family transcriptional regulator [Micrococcus luteus]|uniref:AraC-like ligand-binding domain-containing protein n=1 Tax=Micrococcus luteus TaxID=1270 RepID=UPI000451C76B|nr:helix-turn-helix domain-containing protein [Micrococcus luteus]EZP42996.1 putative AraC family transcriptional regulator [Micrococcus luteus]